MKSVLNLAAAWTFALSAASPATAQSEAKRTQLLCGADRPLVYPGDSVVVRGWVVGETEQAAARRWQWQAAVGNVSGDAVAVWQFGPAESPNESRTLIATVQSAVAGDAAAPMRCDVEVVLAERPKTGDGGNRGNDLSARAFLLNGQEPPTGYGMYSFLLLDAPALTNVETERQINAIATFLLLIQPAAQMEAHRRINQLNLALLPVKHELRLPEQLVVVSEARTLAVQVLKSYDYARAQALLEDFCVKVRGSGPVWPFPVISAFSIGYALPSTSFTGATPQRTWMVRRMEPKSYGVWSTKPRRTMGPRAISGTRVPGPQRSRRGGATWSQVPPCSS